MTTLRRSGARQADHRRGQALVEFSLILVPFLLMLMGILDLGRGIYMNNGVNQAAREIARTTAVHLCDTSSCTLGNSAETKSTVDTQKGLIPGLGSAASSITFSCTTVSDVPDPSTSGCARGNFVKVTVSVPFSVLTPILSMVAPSTLQSTAHVQVP
jgi:Flp pilus assembly protein TadG